MPRVSVLIVNYNGAGFLKACLDSLLKSEGDLEIIVVDNCSTDHSIDLLREYKDKVVVIKNRFNSGFSRGTNIAASYATGDFFFLLNNDTVVPPDMISKLQQYIGDKPDIGALVPKLLNEDGTVQCPGSTLGHWRFKSDEIRDLPFAAGAALMMHRSVYEDIGGLDDNLFFYNDDIDLCKTLLSKKYRIVYFPSASLTHFGGLSTQFRKIGSLIEGYRGGFYIAYKHYGRIAYTLYRVVVLFDIIPRLTWNLITSLFSSTSRQYAAAYLKILSINITGNIFVEHPERSEERL